MTSRSSLHTAAAFVLVTPMATLAHDVPEGLPKELAEQYRQISNQLTVETLRNSLDEKRKANALLQQQTATALKTAAEARQAAAVAQSKAELAARKYPDIKVNIARVFQISNPQRFCDATYFVEWKCHRGDPNATPPVSADKCSFPVDATICGKPAQTGQQMMIEVQYSCGTNIRDARFPFATTAYLTCR